MKKIKISLKDIHSYEITEDYIEMVYEKEYQSIKRSFNNQQEIQDLHENTGKFGKDSNLSDL